MVDNPWLVDSIQDFSCLKCPECTFDSKQETDFQDHAIQNHPLSSVLFENKFRENLNGNIDKEELENTTDISDKKTNSKDEDLVNFLSSVLFEEESGKHLSSIDKSRKKLDENAKEEEFADTVDLNVKETTSTDQSLSFVKLHN